MGDEQHWYRQLDGSPQHKTYVSTTPLPGVLDTIHQVSQVSKYFQLINQFKLWTKQTEEPPPCSTVLRLTSPPPPTHTFKAFFSLKVKAQLKAKMFKKGILLGVIATDGKFNANLLSVL
jgi:hypothetical protein